MGDEDCPDWLTANIVNALRMLAAPASEQIEYEIENKVDADEFALDLDASIGAVIANCEISEDARATLLELDSKLDSMSGAHNAALWTDEALQVSDDWAIVRNLASDALAQLQANST